MSYGPPPYNPNYGCPGYGPPQPSYPYGQGGHGGGYPQQPYPQPYYAQQPQTVVVHDRDKKKDGCQSCLYALLAVLCCCCVCDMLD
ncbi:Hypothetical predicted protein [Mytilus galloprovincialis]|uniref:Cysteine-rich and transmembrane domain-containing protein 1 n=1 Tax=Mytilus galloprovincialis TaxID=29158 RepID=A0A8B6GP81_MYTGA|nr:Hypothetical predicted protein [Mytilus galloprovincialis]